MGVFYNLDYRNILVRASRAALWVSSPLFFASRPAFVLASLATNSSLGRVARCSAFCWMISFVFGISVQSDGVLRVFIGKIYERINKRYLPFEKGVGGLEKCTIFLRLPKLGQEPHLLSFFLLIFVVRQPILEIPFLLRLLEVVSLRQILLLLRHEF